MSWPVQERHIQPAAIGTHSTSLRPPAGSHASTAHTVQTGAVHTRPMPPPV